jgi:hypothetical protein
MSDCNIINIKWEDRGIILGFIYFIAKKYDKMIMKTIYLPDTKLRALMTFLFKDIDFVSNKKKADFLIRIRNTKKGHLNINNINNLPEEISIKKYYLLPWYDNDNPIIMYSTGSKTIKTIDIKKKILKTACERGEPHGEPNYITQKCKNIWDSQLEFNILSKYCDLYNIHIGYVYNLITNYLTADMCGINNQPVPVYYKVEVPKYIPYKVDNYIDRPQEQYIRKPSLDKKQFEIFTDLINKLSNKLLTVNEIITI